MTVPNDILSGILDRQNTSKIFGKMLTKKLTNASFSDILRVRDAFDGWHFLQEFGSTERLMSAILETRSVDAGKHFAHIVRSYRGDTTQIIKRFTEYELFPRFTVTDTQKSTKEFLGAETLDDALLLYAHALTSIKNINGLEQVGMTVFDRALLTVKLMCPNIYTHQKSEQLERGDRYLKRLIQLKYLTLDSLYKTAIREYSPESLSAVDVLLGTGDVTKAAVKYGKIFGYAYATGIITRKMLDDFFGTLFFKLTKSELYHLKVSSEVAPFCVGKHIEQSILCALDLGKTDVNTAYAAYSKYKLIHLMDIASQ